MYPTYEAATAALLEALEENGVSFTVLGRAWARASLKNALRRDTGGEVRRSDFLEKEKLKLALRGEGFATVRAACELLFPLTWAALRSYYLPARDALTEDVHLARRRSFEPACRTKEAQIRRTSDLRLVTCERCKQTSYFQKQATEKPS